MKDNILGFADLDLPENVNLLQPYTQIHRVKVYCAKYKLELSKKLRMDDPLKLETQICFPVYALSREITSLYRPLLNKLGITYPQYLVLLVLWEWEQQSVNQLGQKLHLDNGTLTPLLKRMEQKKLINRVRSTEDERVVLISLTDLGKSLEEKARSTPEQLVKALDARIEDLQELKSVVNKILQKAQ
ncbi:DNA-binding transcriptional regulator, MarR family [Marivirga sericea]|uniref:DNA-binding transcriptional regulator, MarR family n=1 Tax=Marivirga sericea TaxID=1028 RepID=A0A1X7LET9_9BACT|nr:MarR family transcriptional regulator [Marivirga sericea]SMG51893.1 DNA-binding transcriptional regulator, MarR family [Marivirga sericea]